MEPSQENEYLIEHVELLLGSFHRFTGGRLIHTLNAGMELAKEIYFAPFALVSHGTEVEPVFNYGNRAALELFGMGWDEFISLKSKYSAEQTNRESREKLLNEVKVHGYIDNYSGIRIAKGGRRFLIEQATVWNILDGDGHYHGQAAVFSDWKYI